LFLAAAGPWIAALIAGIITEHSSHDTLVVAAPSPFYVFQVMSALEAGDASTPAFAAGICSVAWGTIGLGLLAAGARRAQAVLAEYNRSLAQADALMDAEDAPPPASPATHGAPPSAEPEIPAQGARA
jgi:hypothetical protein